MTMRLHEFQVLENSFHNVLYFARSRTGSGGDLCSEAIFADKYTPPIARIGSTLIVMQPDRRGGTQYMRTFWQVGIPCAAESHAVR